MSPSHSNLLTPQHRIRDMFAVVLGNTLEYFDKMLYVHFAIILRPLFFPSDSSASSTFKSHLLFVTTLSVGYIAKPLGSIVFGYLGDTFGRVHALSLSMLLMGFGTCAIGLLPTTAQIGLWASIALMICRLVQSFSSSGESVGAVLFLIESAPPHHVCLASSLVNFSMAFGGMLAAGFGFLCLRFIDHPESWRLPFIAGAGIAALAYYFRTHLRESPAFRQAQKKTPASRVPLVTVLKYHRRDFFLVAGLASLSAASFFTTYIYIPEVMKEELNLSTQQILGHNTLVMIFDMFCCLAAGYFADRYGVKRALAWMSGVLLLGVIPAFWVLSIYPSYLMATMIQVMLISTGIAFESPVNVIIASLFPVVGRYSAHTLGWYLGQNTTQVLIGYVLLVLKEVVGHIGVAAFLVVISALSLWCLYLSKNQYALTKKDEDDKTPSLRLVA